MEIVILACENWFHDTFHAFADKTDNKDNDVKEKLKETFKVELPSDFFDFWEFCKMLKSENPCGKSEVYFVLFCLDLCKLVFQLVRESNVC